MNWTPEQLDAMESEGNLIVSAAAGAGKTAVLTERIARRIVRGVPVERMLVLTFTRAAAAEMKERIAARLDALLAGAETPEMRQYLLEQSRSVGSAYISTVHAFCARVLRRHYHVAGIAPKARIMDETEAAALVMQVQDTLLTALAVEENPSWRRLLSAFAGEEPAWNAVFATYTFLQSQSAPVEWLDAAVMRYASPEGRAALLDSVLNGCKRELARGIDALVQTRDGLSPEMGAVVSVLDEDLMCSRALLLMRDYDAYREGLQDLSFATMRFPKGTADAEKRPVQAVRDGFKKLVRAQRDRLVRPSAAECGAMERAGTVLLALRDVVLAFVQSYDAAKRDRGVLDYNDLEHLTLAVLQTAEVAEEYRSKLELIFVDEYQDSNRVQEAILDAIRRPDNLFFVGDVKQSIYRFRQAEPGLFLEKLSAFTGARGKRVDLNKNFRSAPEVLDAVNGVFETLMTREAAEMDYDARARLVYGGVEDHGGAELHIIEKTGAETESEGDEALEAAADAEVEARLAADRIAALMESETILDSATGKRRSLRYSDFAVLLRATTHAGLVAETLSQCGVPCYAQLNGGYFDAVEVQVLLNLLRVLDNRRQDVPLISVLLSSIGDFSAEELLRLRASHREGTFSEAFLAAAAHDEKAAAFVELLERYRRESELTGVEQLIGMLLDETGFYEEMGAAFGGRQRQANLDALLNMAHAFEQTGARGVWSFLRHMDLARDNASVGAAQTASANVVRILTVHKSKGLEFPVVFVLQLGARFHGAGGAGNLQLHADVGLGLRFRDESDGREHDTAIRETIRRRLSDEQMAEEQRVLYVACTRAKRRLILIGCLKNAAEKLEHASPAPTPFAVLSASTPLTWLVGIQTNALKRQLHARAAFLDAPVSEPDGPLPEPDAGLLDALKTRFAWRYPYADAVNLPAKASVSRVLGAGSAPALEAFEGMEAAPVPARTVTFDPPAFLAPNAHAPVFFGTAMHAVLERLPLETGGAPEDSAGMAAFVAALAEKGLLSGEQAEVIDCAALAWFVQTPLWNRMQRSARVERELAFGCEMDAAALFATGAEERVLLQGVIDCCFVENGGWVLVDYKTDRVPQGTEASEVAMRHAGQLALYATALTNLSGLPVRERCIVLLGARCVVTL